MNIVLMSNVVHFNMFPGEQINSLIKQSPQIDEQAAV